jgi:putative phosphoribosyl transferase
MQLFADRADAGRLLADALAGFSSRGDVVVLALPRGGVPVGYQVARRLGSPLDLYVVRKLGVPGHEELAMGALAGDGTCVVDEELVASLRVRDAEIEEAVEREMGEIRRREAAYRSARPPANIANKVAIVVDDGLATGATMRAAAMALRQRAPREIVAAVPVAAARTCANLQDVVDRVVCVYAPEPFIAVGLYYQNFEQTSDDEVRRLLAAATQATGRRVSA